MNSLSYGYHGQRYCSWARTHDGGDDDDGVAKRGGHDRAEKRLRMSSIRAGKLGMAR